MKVARLPQALEITGLKRSTFYAKQNRANRQFDASMPRPIKLSERSVGWLCDELEAWVKQRVDASRDH